MATEAHQCPDCGSSFASPSALVDHALTAHVEAETPAAHIRRPRSRRARRIVAGLGMLVGAAFWMMVGLGAAGAFEKDSVSESPDSVVHKIAAEMLGAGAIDNFRAVEPDDGWDTEYEVNDGDGYLQIRNEGGDRAEMEIFAFNDDLYEGIELAAEKRGFVFEE